MLEGLIINIQHRKLGGKLLQTLRVPHAPNSTNGCLRFPCITPTPKAVITIWACVDTIKLSRSGSLKYFNCQWVMGYSVSPVLTQWYGSQLPFAVIVTRREMLLESITYGCVRGRKKCESALAQALCLFSWRRRSE